MGHDLGPRERTVDVRPGPATNQLHTVEFRRMDDGVSVSFHQTIFASVLTLERSLLRRNTSTAPSDSTDVGHIWKSLFSVACGPLKINSVALWPLDMLL